MRRVRKTSTKQLLVVRSILAVMRLSFLQREERVVEMGC